MDAVYKQHIATPMSIRVVKQVPNSPLHVGTAQGHHEGAQGPVILFDPSQGINNAEAMWNVTPGTSGVEGGLGPLEEQHVAEGGVQVRGGYFIDPFPMSEKAFLVGHDMTGDLGEYGIYYIDVWGNRELLHREKEIGCYEPFPLRARQRPPVVADMVRPDVDYATVFVEDVHRDLPGVDGEPIKHLRVSQKLPLPAPTGGPDDGFDYNHLMWRPGGLDHLFGVWTWSPARTIGMVDVEEDGSAYFKVPAGTPVYLQALDEDYTEVRRMRSSFTLQRGEFRGCIGCHESRLEAAGRKPNFPTGTLSKGPQMPKEPSWGINNVLGFEEHIQPILDKHCVSCHGENNPEGGLELTGRNIGGFNQSYRSIFGLKANDPTPIQSIDIHLALHPEVKDHKFITTERDDKEEKERTQDMLESMAINTMPGQLVVISNRNSKEADITMPYQFGSAISTLTRTLLDDPAHRDDVKSKMTDDEWLRLVTWVDYNAVYYNDLVDKGPAKEAGRKLDPALVKRVPYMLPDPWKNPADINPSFLNPFCGFTPAEENE